MLLTRLARDRCAAAAVEFAMIAPILILLYFGAAELTEGFLVDRQVAHAASEIGDLVSQSASATPDQISDYFAAGAAIVSPFATSPLSLRVSSVSTDASGNATVAWSQASGSLAPLATGSSVTLPSGVAGANQSVVMSESQYAYTSNIGLVLKTPLTLSHAYYFEPRGARSVACAACG